MDSLVNAIGAKSSTASGTISVADTNVNVTMTVDAKTSQKDGSSFGAKLAIKAKNGVAIDIAGDAVYASNGDVYFRANNLQKSLDAAIDLYISESAKDPTVKATPVSPESKAEAKSAYNSILGPVIKKIDNQWIKISVSDLKDLSQSSGTQYECTQTVIKKITANNTTESAELKELYAKNKFIVVKDNLGTKDGSLGYVVDVDEAKAKKFGDDFKNTKAYKELNDCSKSDTSQTDNTTTKTDDTKTTTPVTHIEVWVDQWSHMMTAIKGTVTASDSDKTKLDFDIKTTFNAPVTIAIPKDSISLKEVTDSVKSIFSDTSGAAESQSMPL